MTTSHVSYKNNENILQMKQSVSNVISSWGIETPGASNWQIHSPFYLTHSVCWCVEGGVGVGFKGGDTNRQSITCIHTGRISQAQAACGSWGKRNWPPISHTYCSRELAPRDYHYREMFSLLVILSTVKTNEIHENSIADSFLHFTWPCGVQVHVLTVDSSCSARVSTGSIAN